MVSSAAEIVLPEGALNTATPRSVAASTSMLSTPTPARPMTRSRAAMTIDASTSEVWLDQRVALTEALVEMKQQLNAAGTTDDKIQVEIHPQKEVPYAHAIHVFEAVTAAEFQ